MLINVTTRSSALKLHSKAHTVAGLDDRQEFKDWDDILTNDKFSEEQTLLCPPVIAAFDTITAKWYVVAIENLKPVKWNTAAMNHLVLAKSRKELLHAVIEQHSKKKIGDLIQGKGIGVVILLHGPSGVGKTLTAGINCDLGTLCRRLVLTVGYRKCSRIDQKAAHSNEHSSPDL